MDSKCARCGKDPADGFGAIGDNRYCHGRAVPSHALILQMISDGRPTCYEKASWDQYSPVFDLLPD